MNSSSLSPLSRYMRYNTRISSRSSLSRSASENFCSNCCKPGKKRFPQAHKPEIPIFSPQRQEGVDGMYTLVQNDQEILRHCKKADQNRCDQQKAQGGRNGILLRVGILVCH